MTLDELRNLGADVDDGIKRCMNNEDFYLKMVTKCLSDDKFDQLGDALLEGDLDRAFELAHAFKGVVSNLSITPLIDDISRMNELLRGRTVTDYTDMYDSMMRKWKDFTALL